MLTSPLSPGCKVLSIASARPADDEQPTTALAQLCGQRSMNLAELASSIRADRSLSYFVTETACTEFGWPWLSLEDSIVLLGARRLRELLAGPIRRGRSASQLRRSLHRNSITPPANLRLLETSQGELE